MPTLFCHIGWMRYYQGNSGRTDKLQGGGSYVEENETGYEVCNFLRCNNGHFYGHVETIRGERDRKIRIEELGASPSANFVDGITVIWTATDPVARGRRVVGWYQNALVFRERQPFHASPSNQHRADGLESFRIRASNATLLPTERRYVALGTGRGWMGHAQWWFPERRVEGHPEISHFLAQIDELLTEDTAQESVDIAEIESSSHMSPTEKKALIDARIGQGQFRRSLEQEWSGCAITGCGLRELLRASHIKPWAASDHRERLDRNNGLLLLANLDAAFDCGLIAFSDSGQILISSQMTPEARHLLGLIEGMTLRVKPSRDRQAYLAYHRREKFRT